MQTFHIHISGMVQGVGFRPLVCKLALDIGMKGWVCNGNDGVHIELNAPSQEIANEFCRQLVDSPPANAYIQEYSVEKVALKNFEDFKIITSRKEKFPDLLLTPDIAICKNCKKEMETLENRRFDYAFTTCLHCGPRYSITTSLPYDRENTTMSHLKMCTRCTYEYNNLYDSRHYSQTNSCPQCAIPIHLYNKHGQEILCHEDGILSQVNIFLQQGKILAVKGIGGYLLLCDAANASTIKLLRKRKQRPAKPFAVMYDTIKAVERDVQMTLSEKEALESKEAPIVLCTLNSTGNTSIAIDEIAKGLDKLGVFLPYSPLLKIITTQYKNPLIATSGNLSGSPIIYKDEEALQWLGAFADYIISFERAIVTPQDDSVIQFTISNKRILIRRSRGLAPNYVPVPFNVVQPALAMGSELKSAFALAHKKKCYISQYLGDQQSFESNQSYRSTLWHLEHLLKISPRKIIVDKHPQYIVSNFGREIAASKKLPLCEVQHHVAHFTAVLAENNLLDSFDKFLGVVWDGAGYGDDGHIWGSEFFIFEEKKISRAGFLKYFPQLLGNKMSLEPRVSALVLLHEAGQPVRAIENSFNKVEWEYYQKLLGQQSLLLTSSMGRLLDGIASLLGLQQLNTYEGEAAMKLEVSARACCDRHLDSYDFIWDGTSIDWRGMIENILKDKNQHCEIAYIARKVFVTLVSMIERIARSKGLKKIAFSGGVFQNSFLCELVEQMLSDEFELFWHRQLSPNDECISFGQLAYDTMVNGNGAGEGA